MSAYLATHVPSDQQTAENIGEVGPLSTFPSMNVREWADNYCRSEMIMKDFKFKKVSRWFSG